MHKLVTILFCFFTIALMNAQQASPSPRPAANQAAPSAATSSEDAAATRQDIQRMKALVQQMQTNLAFVTTIQGPLKHQFELEIEMWQLEIARMERRLSQGGNDATKK